MGMLLVLSGPLGTYLSQTGALCGTPGEVVAFSELYMHAYYTGQWKYGYRGRGEPPHTDPRFAPMQMKILDATFNVNYKI